MSARQDLVHRVKHSLSCRASIAIHSGPGSGKTWVADEVTAGLHADDVRVVRTDLSVCRSGAQVLADIKKRLEPSASTPNASVDQSDIFEEWRQLTQYLTAEEAHTVLILDEFDEVLTYPDALDLLKLLRELIHRPRFTHCSALFASRRPLKTIEERIQGISTLASLCYTEYLGAVTRADLDTVWDGGKDLAFDDQDACLAWSAGNPTLVNYWLLARPDARPSDSAEQVQAEVMLRQVAYLATLGLLNASAQLVLGPVLDDWLLERRQLVSLGVIARDDEDDRATLSAHETFCFALSRETWDLDPWGILGQTELQLRALIEQVLTEDLGSDWISTLRVSNPQVRALVEGAEERQARDSRQFGRPGPWIAFTYPADLWKIISCRWDVFAPVFVGGDKSQWRSRFERFASYRTPMAHNRPESLGPEQRTDCRIVSEQILRCIDDFVTRREAAQPSR